MTSGWGMFSPSVHKTIWWKDKLCRLVFLYLLTITNRQGMGQDTLGIVAYHCNSDEKNTFEALCCLQRCKVLIFKRKGGRFEFTLNPEFFRYYE